MVALVTLSVGCSTGSGPAGLDLPAQRQNAKGQAVIDPLGRVVLTPADAAKGLAPLPARISIDALGVKGFLAAVEQNVQEFWTVQLAKLHRQAPRPRLLLPARGETVSSKCLPGKLPRGQADQLAFFCPLDNTIVVAQVLATQVDAGKVEAEAIGTRTTANSGDLAVAYILAHEFAHAVQFKLGLFDSSDGPSPRIEQHADCWAGVWAHDVITHHTLEDANLGEAVAAAALVGDYDIEAAGHHGTPKERVAAFLRGYAGVRPSSCQPLLNRRS